MHSACTALSKLSLSLSVPRSWLFFFLSSFFSAVLVSSLYYHLTFSHSPPFLSSLASLLPLIFSVSSFASSLFPTDIELTASIRVSSHLLPPQAPWHKASTQMLRDSECGSDETKSSFSIHVWFLDSQLGLMNHEMIAVWGGISTETCFCLKLLPIFWA